MNRSWFLRLGFLVIVSSIPVSASAQLLADSDAPKSTWALVWAFASGVGGWLGSLTAEVFKGRRESRAARLKMLREAEMRYRERQLEEFYGPIYGHVKILGSLWKMYMERGALDPITGQVTEFIRTQNDRILNILQTKFHLVEGAKIPESFQKYAAAVTIYNLGTRVGNGQTPSPVCNRPEASFPDQFFAYIIEATETLKARLDELYRKSLSEEGAGAPELADQIGNKTSERERRWSQKRDAAAAAAAAAGR